MGKKNHKSFLSKIPHKTVSIYKVKNNNFVIIDPEKMKILELNKTASLIFKLCDGKHSIDFIIREYGKKFNISINKAEKDVVDMMKMFKKLNLINFNGDKC